MIINGLSPGVTIPEPITANLEKDKLEQDIRAEKQALQSQSQEETKKEKKSPDFEMNEYYLKELLFLMSSRGNAATIEKLAQLLRKERETLSTKVK